MVLHNLQIKVQSIFHMRTFVMTHFFIFLTLFRKGTFHLSEQEPSHEV